MASSTSSSLAAAACAGVLFGVEAWVDGPGLLAAGGAVAAAGAVRGARTDVVAGFVMGLIWHGMALAWLPAAWSRFGGPAAVPWLLVFWQALPVTLALGVAGLAVRRGVAAPAACALSWALADGLADQLDVLPWSPALLLVDSSVWLWPAALGGRAVLSGALMGWGALVFSLGPRRAIDVAIVVSAIGIAWRFPVSTPPRARVGLVQPDVGALEGRTPSTADDRADRVRQLVTQAQELGATWVVTPEGAWPHDPGDAPGQRRRDLAARWAGSGSVLLGASVGHDPPTNSALLMTDGHVEGRVDKRWRVPVAERRWAGLGRDRYRAGTGSRVVSAPDARVAVWICYEDLFAAASAQAGDATLGVAATNDAWMAGRGSEQHLAATRLLAVTTRRWVVRPALSGPSAVIDPHGAVHWRTSWVDGDDGSEGTAVVVSVPLRSPTWWGGRLDPVAPWLAGLGLVALGMRRRPAEAS